MKGNYDINYNTVELLNLTTGYLHNGEERVISKNLNALLAKNTLTCLIGPNGGGKSTLIRTIVGFLNPLKGQIKIAGQNLNEIKTDERAKLISVVLTERGYINAMTGKELVEMGRSPYSGFFGKLSKKDKEMVYEAIEAVGAKELINRRVSSLSDGERQKLFIAKALAQDTPLIVLDEPTAFLDFPSKVEIMLLMKELARTRDKTILLSTHDLDIAFPITDNLWLLDKILGLSHGTVEEIGLKGIPEKYFRHKGLKYNPEHKQFTITI